MIWIVKNCSLDNSDTLGSNPHPYMKDKPCSIERLLIVCPPRDHHLPPKQCGGANKKMKKKRLLIQLIKWKHLTQQWHLPRTPQKDTQYCLARTPTSEVLEVSAHSALAQVELLVQRGAAAVRPPPNHSLRRGGFTCPVSTRLANRII